MDRLKHRLLQIVLRNPYDRHVLTFADSAHNPLETPVP